MKKNLVSILILAFVMVDVVLTSILLFTLASPVKKTGKLVSDISSALSLELGGDVEDSASKVSIDNIASHDIDEEFTIPLKHGTTIDANGNTVSDSKDHYYIVKVSLMMNTADEDYAKYAESISSHDSLFKGIIVDVIGSHTLEEAQNNPEGMRNEILAAIQEMYDGSTFIYKVVFSNVMFQ